MFVVQWFEDDSWHDLLEFGQLHDSLDYMDRQTTNCRWRVILRETVTLENLIEEK